MEKTEAGNVEFLIKMQQDMDMKSIVVEKEKFQGKDISSTYVREELKMGHMETVNVLLNRPYSISGIVAKGNQLGRTIDIPTINVYPTEIKLLPAKWSICIQNTY